MDISPLAPRVTMPAGDLTYVLSVFVRAGLGVLAFIFIIEAIVAVFLLLTHGGNVERQEDAIEKLKKGVLGIIGMAVSSALSPYLIGAAVRAAGKYL